MRSEEFQHLCPHCKRWTWHAGWCHLCFAFVPVYVGAAVALEQRLCEAAELKSGGREVGAGIVQTGTPRRLALKGGHNAEEARRVARLQTRTRQLRRDLKTANAELKLARRNLRALASAQTDPFDQAPPLRMFGESAAAKVAK